MELVQPSPMIASTGTTPVAARTDAENPVATLTLGLARGEAEAFQAFQEQYFNRLYRLLLAATRGDEHQAQDALQETLLRVAKYVRRFDSETIFWSWLTRVARTAALDARRKQSRYRSLLERFAFWRTSELAPPVPDTDPLHPSLADALGDLPAQDRWLLEQKYYAGATVRDIAFQAGNTEKAIESRLLRLRRQLRERLLQEFKKP